MNPTELHVRFDSLMSCASDVSVTHPLLIRMSLQTNYEQSPLKHVQAAQKGCGGLTDSFFAGSRKLQA